MIIYDCEIIKAIAGKNDEIMPGIEYCQGWRDFNNMGISVIGAYDYEEQRTRVFMEDNFSEFQALLDKSDIVIGFNNHSFDDALCGHHGITVRSDKSYDLLAEIWTGAGLSKNFSYPSHCGFGLNACADKNLGLKKTGYGGYAPVLWQQGKKGAVVDYCLNDVHLTRLLLDKVIENGFIIDPRGENKNPVVAPIIKVLSPFLRNWRCIEKRGDSA